MIRAFPPTGSHWYAVWVHPINWDHDSQAHQYGKDGFCYGEVLPNEFARMIAKIAHSYAVATLGVTFIPVLAKSCVLSDFVSFPKLDWIDVVRKEVWARLGACTWSQRRNNRGRNSPRYSGATLCHV
jgi:hypothetical protein